ncbi:hypothetical protein [Streptomyces sp. XD-27]|nr:hypothetical protein [Streptomyces sp. XD-27]WKX73850.1 hypothetical protein Q3Y56_31805 [Streptomyces sp. XD-27]
MRTSELGRALGKERFDAEFAKAIKGTGIEPRATGGHCTGSATAP